MEGLRETRKVAAGRTGRCATGRAVRVQIDAGRWSPDSRSPASVPPRSPASRCLVAAAFFGAALGLLGCAGLDDEVFDKASLVGKTDGPRELIVLCRSRVLSLDDGTRSPGIVAQVFLTGGDELAPVVAPPGDFSFRAFDRESKQEAGSWQIPAGEVSKHQIDNSLGPCYAFWLPLEPTDKPLRKLVVHGRFVYEDRELGSNPVRVLVPGK